MNIQSVLDYVHDKSGHPLYADEGLMWGDPGRTIAKLLFCWMADASAIKMAASKECSHIVAHESVFHPNGEYERERVFGEWSQWKVNRHRLELLKQYEIVLTRVHGSMDDITILDCFAELLGLGTPVVNKPDWVKIYQIPPITICSLVNRVKKAVRMNRLRVAVPEGFSDMIHRIGLPWGGMGLFVNTSYLQSLIAEKVDVLIGGETDTFGFRFATEIGIPYIETGHEVTENPGIRRFANMVRDDLGIETVYHPMQTAWTVM